MLAKCPNVADSRKIVSFRDILSETDTKFAPRTRVGWRSKDRLNLTKVSKLPKNLSEIYFHSFVKNKNWYFFLFIFTYLVDCIFLNKYFLFILLVVLTRKTTFFKSFAKCHFVSTSPMSKQQHFWPVPKNFYDMSTTCFVSRVVLASFLVSQNATCTTKMARTNSWYSTETLKAIGGQRNYSEILPCHPCSLKNNITNWSTRCRKVIDKQKTRCIEVIFY